LARVKLEQGDEETAQASAGYALDLNEWSQNNEGIAMSLHVIAKIEMAQEKYPGAESRLKDARDIYVALGQRIGLAGTWADLSILRARTRRLAEAQRALESGRKAAAGVGHIGVQKRLQEAEVELQAVSGDGPVRNELTR
jgi:hypothetical protein